MDPEQFTEESAGLSKTGIQAASEVSGAPTPVSDEDTALLQEIREARKFARSYESQQRASEKIQEEFEGEDMWDAEARTQREEHEDEDGTKVAGKPTLEAHLLDQNVQQVVSGARRARLALTVKPKAGIKNTKISGYYKGLVRSIQQESNATAQRLWGLERTVKFGRGGYRIIADYANAEDFDLDLIIERILDYSRVWWDPYSVQADRSDAEWNLEDVEMSEATRLRRWKDKPLIKPTSGMGEGEEYADWFIQDGENPEHNRVLVGTFRKVVHKVRKLGFHPKVGEKWLEEIPEPFRQEVIDGAHGTRLRDVDDRSVMIYTVDGTQILERKPWHGRYIPVMEIIGREYVIKGKRRYKGIVANAMDILRAINVVLSAAVELGGMLPRSPYIMYAGQDAQFETEWDELFTTNRSRIHVAEVTIDGKPAPFPQRQVTDIQIQGMLLLLRMLHEMYHAVTGSVAPQFRASDPKDRSGKAIEALQQQGADGTSGFLDNLASITLPYEGKVLVDAIPHYYDRPGRIVRVMGEENDDETAIMIRRPFIRGEGGEPVGVPCPACKGQGTVMGTIAGLPNPFGKRVPCEPCEGLGFATEKTMPEEWNGKAVEFVDFSKGKHKVVAALDRDHKTKQDEALAGMQALSEAVPEMVPLYADLWVRAMAFSGSNEIADRIKAHGPMGKLDESLEDMPPAMQAKFQAMQQQQDQLMQALEEATKMLETDAIKTAGQKEIAVIRAGMQAQLDGIKAQGKVLEQDKKLAADKGLAVLHGRIEEMQQAAQHRHEMIMELLKEQKEKEVERHSVGLHEQAAAAADARIGMREEAAAQRETAQHVGDQVVATTEADKDREHKTQLAREGQEGKERLTAAQLAAQKEQGERDAELARETAAAKAKEPKA